MEHLDLTVRALKTLKCLNITDEYQLVDYVLPEPNTILERPIFPFYVAFRMGRKTYDELKALQDKLTLEIKEKTAISMGQMMLENPEDYGLVNDGRLDDDYCEDDGPEYDGAGFTEEDRIVNGQYRNNQQQQ